MKYGLMCLVAGLLALGAPAQADVVGGKEEEKEGVGGVNIGPIRAGQLEVTPIMSVRFSVAVACSIALGFKWLIRSINGIRLAVRLLRGIDNTTASHGAMCLGWKIRYRC